MEQTSHNGASPGPPKPSVTHPPPSPRCPFRDAPRAAHCCGVSKQPGIPGLAPTGGKPSLAEHTHPNSGTNTATSWHRAAFNQRPGRGHAGGPQQPARCFSYGLFLTPVSPWMNCFNYRGGSLCHPLLCTVLHCPGTQRSHTPRGKRQAYHRRERKLR